MADTTNSTASGSGSTEEKAKRQREQVDALLAQSAATGTGRVMLGDGSPLSYRTVAAFVPVRKDGLDGSRGEVQAAVFTTAYLADGAGGDGVSASQRPVCFAFNGGPGSASLWLHLGALGPKRVPINDDGTMPPPPYQVVDNPLTWLAHFDLVFVDPPHTGWSLTASDDARKTMLGVDGDVAALSEVMHAWLTRHKRWNSAVYLVGESYGTTRGAALADKLLDVGIALRGLVLVSCAMDLQSLVFTPRNDLPYALYLPGFAQAAQFHSCLKGPLAASAQAAREAAEAFVADEYLAALHAGARIDPRKRSRVARRVAELSGLPVAFVEEKNLRVSDQDFFFELLRDRGLIVGRLEARVTGPMAASRTRQWEFDPGIEAISSPYVAAAQAYFSDALGIEQAQRYEFLNREVNEGWDWNRGKDKGLNFTCTSNDLARALRRNPHLRVLVASGRYDLGTPYSASDWSLAQLDAPAEVLARVEHHYYDAGHMMYTRGADLAKLQRDLGAWLAAA